MTVRSTLCPLIAGLFAALILLAPKPLLAKEIVMHSFPAPQLAPILERLQSIANHGDEGIGEPVAVDAYARKHLELPLEGTHAWSGPAHR